MDLTKSLGAVCAVLALAVAFLFSALMDANKEIGSAQGDCNATIQTGVADATRVVADAQKESFDAEVERQKIRSEIREELDREYRSQIIEARTRAQKAKQELENARENPEVADWLDTHIPDDVVATGVRYSGNSGSTKTLRGADNEDRTGID